MRNIKAKFISEPVHNDDGEDDPEYNVLCDDDFSKSNDF